MENSKFDKLLKQTYNTDTDVPTELNWENMNISMPKKKNKKRVFMLLFFGLFLIIASAVIFYVNQYDAVIPLEENQFEN